MIAFFKKIVVLIESLAAIIASSISPIPTPVVQAPEQTPIVVAESTATPTLSPTPNLIASITTPVPTPTPSPSPTPKIEDVIVQLQELKKEILAYTPEPTPTPQIIYIVQTPASTPTPILTPIPTLIPTPTPLPLGPEIRDFRLGYPGTHSGDSNPPLGVYTFYVVTGNSIKRIEFFSATYDLGQKKFFYQPISDDYQLERDSGESIKLRVYNFGDFPKGHQSYKYIGLKFYGESTASTDIRADIAVSEQGVPWNIYVYPEKINQDNIR